MSDSKLEVQQNSSCPALVNQTVCIQAGVTITPSVVIGTIKSFCIGKPFIGACKGKPAEECSFMVSQSICVQIPLTFSASAVAVPAGVVCGTPGEGSCSAC